MNKKPLHFGQFAWESCEIMSKDFDLVLKEVTAKEKELKHQE